MAPLLDHAEPLVRWILANPDRCFTCKEIAADTGLDAGQIGNTISHIISQTLRIEEGGSKPDGLGTLGVYRPLYVDGVLRRPTKGSPKAIWYPKKRRATPTMNDRPKVQTKKATRSSTIAVDDVFRVERLMGNGDLLVTDDHRTWVMRVVMEAT